MQFGPKLSLSILFPAVRGRTPPMTSGRRKPEDSADGCRGLAKSDLDRAAEAPVGHARTRFERSADAWTARAELLKRLEASSGARADLAERRSAIMQGESEPERASVSDDGIGTA
jgi:hypothetical protein